MQSNKQKKTAFKLVAVSVAMFAFGFALVPLYDIVCDITGLNGKTQVMEKSDAENVVMDEMRTINVEFLATLNQSLAMNFEPAQRKMATHTGEMRTIDYIAHNHTQRTIVAQAVPSLSPANAAAYFNKVECFCFESQTFAAGEKRLLTMRFIVDPALPDNVKTVSLSYTLFDVTPKT